MNYLEICNQALAATVGVDREVRGLAFQEVLRHMLANPSRSVDRQLGAHEPQRPSEERSAPKTGAAALSHDQLTALRDYYVGLHVEGSEMLCFVIAGFLAKHCEIERFSEGDIAACYRALISLKQKVPAVENIQRSLNWLCAPSRRKLWLTRHADGTFSLSNTGLIALNELEDRSRRQQ